MYKITNLLNSKVYVGRTNQDLNVRFKQHKLGMGFGKKMPIHLAIKKYRISNFKIEKLTEALSELDCKYLEVYYINLLNTIAPNGYNVDLPINYIKDNPYLIAENKGSAAVQSIEGEPTNVEYNPSKRTQYPIDKLFEMKKYFISNEEKNRICEDFKNGLTCVQLEKKHKRSNRVIKKALVEQNLYVSLDKKICRTY